MSEVFDKATEKTGEALSKGLTSLGEQTTKKYSGVTYLPTAAEAAQKRWGFKKFDPVYRGLSGELRHGRGKWWPRGYTQPPTAEEYPTKGTEAEWATPEILKDFLIMLEGARHPMSAVEGFKGLIGPTGSAIGVGMTKAAIKGGGIDPTVMRMFVGEEAKLPKKVMKDLDRAKRLDRNGRDRDYVYDQTGWFKDPQSKNKWKFEISDAEARIKQNVDLTKPNLTLGDVLHHPELYKVHPEFKKHPVIQKDADVLNAAAAHYSPGTGEIFVKTFLDKNIRTRLQQMDELLHPRHRKMKTLTQKNKERMRDLIWEFGYRTKKEVDKIPDKQLKDIIEKEVIKDYTKLKESVPHYLTNTDWLINQRKLGAVPNTKQYNRLLNPENSYELTEIRGTRGIWEPDYIHIPEKPNGRMWSEQATRDLIGELRWGSGRGAKDSIQRRIKINPREARDYRKKPGEPPTYSDIQVDRYGKIREPLQYIGRDMEGEIALVPKYQAKGIQEFPEPPTYIEKGKPVDLLYDRDYMPGTVTRSMDRLLSFLHEAQHGMQHRSDFSRGTSWSGKLGWPDRLKYMKRELKKIGAKIETKKQPGLFKVDEAIPDTKLRHDPFPEWMTDEFFHYPVSIKYKGKKYSIEEGKESWPSELINELTPFEYSSLQKMNKLGKEREAYWDYYKRPRKEQSPFAHDRPEFYLKGHEGRQAMSGKEQYLTKAGEAEARNVERRSNLPAQTFPRKDTDVPPPWETLDVKEETLWSSIPSRRSSYPYPFMPKKKTGGGLSGLGEK